MTTIVPFNKETIDTIIKKHSIDFNNTGIHKINQAICEIEQCLNTKYIHLEFGIPGLPLPDVAKIQFSEEELSLASKYPPLDGLPVLKNAAADFIHKFYGIDINPQLVIPTVGTIQGSFASIGTLGNLQKRKNKILVIAPAFPMTFTQISMWGLEVETVEVYGNRNEMLLQSIEARFRQGTIAGILYSSPNNPSWITFNETELEGIGQLCNKYDVFAIEDLAYMGMNLSSEEFSEQPRFSTIAKYTDRYILLISASKIFSYAGERIGLCILSPKFFNYTSNHLLNKFGLKQAGRAFTEAVIGTSTGGVATKSQLGLAKILKACVEEQFCFIQYIQEYRSRAMEMKKVFKQNGFEIVYEKNGGEIVGDGFFFTVKYPGLKADELLKNLLYFGISAISLKLTRSFSEEGIRICTSLCNKESIDLLNRRLRSFHHSHDCPNDEGSSEVKFPLYSKAG